MFDVTFIEKHEVGMASKAQSLYEIIQTRNGTREHVVSLFLTAHSQVSQSNNKIAIATGIRAGQSINFFRFPSAKATIHALGPTQPCI